jgi:MFS transporter, UMF1 family
MKPGHKRAIAAWCLYDFACASFAIIVTTFIFSTYFVNKVAANPIIGTYQWANATALAGVFIAFASPLLGAIADHGGSHKRSLFFFTWMSIISTALLWFAYPQVEAVYFTLTCVVLGTIAYEISQVFYNAFLPRLAPRQYIGRISGWGWGAGYFGGIIALSLALVLFIKTHFLGLNMQSAEPIRLCGPFVAIWYALFSLPLFFLVPDLSPKKPLRAAFYLGCKELFATLKKLPQEKNILLYLIAHMIYTDGLNTLFAFGGIYAAGTYGFSFEQVLIFGISMNISAGIGAVSLAFLNDYLGAKYTVLLSLLLLILLGIPILLLQQQYLFWAAALSLAIFIGPVQSASRTLMLDLIKDQSKTAEFFGLYALSGKISAFIGPWILGLVTMTFKSQRLGMASIFIFFALGALLLLPIRVARSINEA